MRNRLSIDYTYAIIALWAIACFVFFQGFYSYHLFYKEQTQLFLFSTDYLSTYFSKPAWLACMGGDFLTQFFYYKFAGAAILTVVLLLLGDFTRRSFERCMCGRFSFLIALIVMTVEAVFYLRADYRLSSAVALIGSMGLFLFYCLILKEWAKWCVAVLFVILGYWMFGYGCFVFVLLVVLHDIGQPKVWIKLALFVLAVGFPLFMRAHYLLTWQTSLSYPGVGNFQKPNFTLEKILALDNEYYFGNYDKVLKIVHQSDASLPEVSYFYNLVQARRGLLSDSLLNIKQQPYGLFMKLGPNASMIDLYIGGEVFNLCGDMTFDEHSAMLANVFSFQNRNARMIKRLAEVNLVNNDTAAALKYLRILQKTFVYRKWSAARMPGSQTPIVKDMLQQKRQYVNRLDTLRGAGDYRLILTGLLRSNPQNVTALDYLLCDDLLRKDISSFKKDYDTFYLLRSKRLYQEALLIYLAGTKAKPEDCAKYHISSGLLKEFNEYTAIYVQTKGNHWALRDKFGHTYWYYFHFINKR